MAFANVQRVGKGANAASISIGSGDGWATPTSGNLLVVSANSDALVSITGTWTAGPSVIDGNGTYIWYRISDGSETTITCTPSVSDKICITAAEYSGNAASPFDTSNTSTIASSSGTTTTSVSVTTTAAGDLIIAAACLHSFGGGSGPTSPSWTNSFVNQISATSTVGTADSADCTTFYAEQIVGAATSYSTSASWTNAASDRQELVIAFKAAAVAASIPYNPQRTVTTRDPGEAWWIQRDRRDANTVAAAADTLPSPLDTSWQAGGRHWHLYNDTADAAPRTWQAQQRQHVSDPGLLTPAADVTYTPQRQLQIRDTGEAQWLQRRPGDPTLLNTAQLENELLGGAETITRVTSPATNAARWWMPQQPPRVGTTPGLLDTALLEGALLGGADDLRRRGNAADHTDRREVPQQRPYISEPTLLNTAQLEGALLGGATTTVRVQVPATHADRREVPAQRPYISDPSFYPTSAPTDPLTVAYGAGGSYWWLYNTASAQVDRREVPQQRRYVADPGLLSSAQLENELLGGGDTGRHLTWFTDRRITVTSPRFPDPNLLNQLDVPLLARSPSLAAHTDRRRQPFQPVRYDLPAVAADPLILLGDLTRRLLTPATHASRRQTVPERLRQADQASPVPPTVKATSTASVTAANTSTVAVLDRNTSTPAVTDRNRSTGGVT